MHHHGDEQADHKAYVLFVRRRNWTVQRFGEHLRDAWTRLLLDAP